MARAKRGGTTAKLRGVVGDVIYQIVRNPSGMTEQKIIAYTKEKYNANTKYQALARMQIAFYQRCMTVLTPIIKSSFQGVKTGVTSVNYFVSINMKLIQEDCYDNWMIPRGFCYPFKGRAEESWGLFVISQGSYTPPSLFSWQYGRGPYYWPTFRFNLSGMGKRLYDLRKAFRYSYNDTINLLAFCGTYQRWAAGLLYIRLTFNRQFGDYTQITQANAANVFKMEWQAFDVPGTAQKRVSLNAQYNPSTQILSIQPVLEVQGLYSWLPLDCMAHSWIFSHKKGNVWERNTNRFFTPCELDISDEWGRAPVEVFDTWDENYDGSDYDDYFKK